MPFLVLEGAFLTEVDKRARHDGRAVLVGLMRGDDEELLRLLAVHNLDVQVVFPALRGAAPFAHLRAGVFVLFNRDGHFLGLLALNAFVANLVVFADGRLRQRLQLVLGDLPAYSGVLGDVLRVALDRVLLDGGG